MSKILKFCAGVLLIGAAPALAQAPQPRLVVVSADAPFAHVNSGLSLPAALLGLPRTRVLETEAPQLDIAAEYTRADADILTVYVYRATSGAVPVWFDRARWAIETRPVYGTPTIAVPPTPIAPPGRSTASGLIGSWSLAGSEYKGTGVALLPLGDWLVKLRYSSKTRDGTDVAERLRAAVTALAWPTGAPDAPVAAAIADCATPLTFKGTAKSAKVDGASALLGALMVGVASEAKDKGDAPPATWCRDAARLDTAGVYRANAADNAYLLALSDAGRGVWVAPSVGALLMGKGKPNWAVDLILPGRTINYPPQDRLPAPARVLELLSGPAISSATTWGGKSTITLPSGVR